MTEYKTLYVFIVSLSCCIILSDFFLTHVRRRHAKIARYRALRSETVRFLIGVCNADTTLQFKRELITIIEDFESLTPIGIDWRFYFWPRDISRQNKQVEGIHRRAKNLYSDICSFYYGA